MRRIYYSSARKPIKVKPTVYLTVPCTIIRITDKAIFINVKDTRGIKLNHWIPKSQVKNLPADNTPASLEVAEWFINRCGLATQPKEREKPCLSLPSPPQL